VAVNFREIRGTAVDVWFESNWLIRGAVIVIAGAALFSGVVALFT
jgi:hypothetical protein